ncbi:hypothetical protein PG993_013734 [Apiospora rasikravindrae]|uniref:Uncharacterized protein n=1 Tax=Apiospora rasikravindrae TaxID=990691 RepID=A0ABR1RR53_9PEZI
MTATLITSLYYSTCDLFPVSTMTCKCWCNTDLFFFFQRLGLSIVHSELFDRIKECQVLQEEEFKDFSGARGYLESMKY